MKFNFENVIQTAIAVIVAIIIWELLLKKMILKDESYEIEEMD